MNWKESSAAKHTKTSQTAPARAALMDDRERDAYSLRNALLYLSDPGAHGRTSGLELDVTSRARRLGLVNEQERGLFVPWEVLTRDLVVGTPTAGGNLVATDVHRDRLIELLRPASVVISAGADLAVDLIGNAAIPRMLGGSSVQWVGENAAPDESQPSFDQVTMSPKTAAAYVDIGRRLVLQTGGDVSRFVSNDLRAAVGTALDLAALAGTGTSNQPRGLLNTAGVGSVAGGADGAAPTYAHVVELEAAVANANTLLEAPAYVTNTRVRAVLEKTQTFSGTNGEAVWRANPAGDMVKGRRGWVSNNVPHTLTKGTSVGVCSAIIFGNWSDLIIGMWGAGITLMADPYTHSTTGALRLVVLLDCDVAVRYPTSFSTMKDALAGT